jgi:ketosteroid isomerase-like protein
MSGDDNLATIRRVYEAMGARDVETLVDLFAPDVSLWQAPELPWGGAYEGHDGALTFFGRLVETIESAVETQDLYAAGDHVVQRGRTRGTVIANGAEFDVAETHLWELRAGKVICFESYIDTPAMLAALQS